MVRKKWLGVLLVLLVGVMGPIFAGCSDIPPGERATKQERQGGEEQNALGINTVEDVVEFYLEAAVAGDLSKARLVVPLRGISDTVLQENLLEAKGFVDAAGGLANVGIAEQADRQTGTLHHVLARVTDSPAYAEFAVDVGRGYSTIGIVSDDDVEGPGSTPSSDPAY